VSAVLVMTRVEWGVALSAADGVGIAVFEVVESLVVGLDYWLHALRLGPAPSPIAGAESVGALLGIPIPLWLQPCYFILGVIIVALSLWLHAQDVRHAPHLPTTPLTNADQYPISNR
jgi:hypothetical protein